MVSYSKKYNLLSLGGKNSSKMKFSCSHTDLEAPSELLYFPG
uniref:Uncharacterized protein n=1 Tax=Arundo donax TaxID=35708 RepID=A0A0A9G5Y2_ARUDO